MRALTIPTLVAFLALSANVQATIFAGGASTIEDNEDGVFFMFASAAAEDFDLTITRYKDLNNDGDLADLGETVNIVSLVDATSCAGNPTVSCTFVANARTIVIFRNATSEHSPGNYSFTLRTEDALQVLVDALALGFAIKDTKATENRIDAFTSDCHGTGINLCINGHTTAIEDSALLRSLGVFAWLLIIAVLSHVTRMNRMILVVLALLPIMYVLGNLAAFEPEMLIAILIGCTAVFIALAFPQETPDRA